MRRGRARSSGRRSPARPGLREFDINAIRYGESGKRIDIAVRSDGNQVSISFTNYGDPIPERDLPFIFDRFYRVEASCSKQTGGTGLGLAITKSIVEVQGGEIRVRSDRRERPLKRGFLKSYSDCFNFLYCLFPRKTGCDLECVPLMRALQNECNFYKHNPVPREVLGLLLYWKKGKRERSRLIHKADN